MQHPSAVGTLCMVVVAGVRRPKGAAAAAAAAAAEPAEPSVHSRASYDTLPRQPPSVRLGGMLSSIYTKAGAAAATCSAADAMPAAVLNALPGSWAGEPRQFTLKIEADFVTCTQ